MNRLRVLPSLDIATYHRHALHGDDRLWIEKNCYVDVCIELVHALGLEPLAMLGSCAALDFEGDNFTFYKPSHDEMRALYGVDIQELNVWRPLVEHAVEHVGTGKFLSTEADAFFLPDVAGTDYRRNHVKTTIIIAEIDAGAKSIGYFHNAGYYALSGDDFDGVLCTGGPAAGGLPLFAELVKIDRLVRRPAQELGPVALALLASHVARRPADNPIVRFGDRLARDLPLLQDKGVTYYHAWAFGTIRQLGAAFELLALHLRWLDGAAGLEGLARAAEAFERLSTLAKTLILKAARAVNSRKPLDPAGTIDEMAASWARGMEELERLPARVPVGIA
jgi:hypothetical protein